MGQESTAGGIPDRLRKDLATFLQAIRNREMEMKLSGETYCRDPDRAFNEAIEGGWLSSLAGTPRYAGTWMYMYSIERTDYFKNINRRNYIEIPQPPNDLAHFGS